MLTSGPLLTASEFKPSEFKPPAVTGSTVTESTESASEEQRHIRTLGMQAGVASEFPELTHENLETELIRRGLAVGEAGNGLLLFEPPVDADVSDPFRPPEGPYGPGNRGIEYHTDVGDTVRASAAGEVSFAGLVARELYVTLDHGGGVFSSYSYLSRISVTQGQRVSQGDVIGLAGERLLHFGVRVNGEYVDPMTFVAERRVSVRLIPNEPLSVE